MEISLREWLIIGGIIVIALILFDGWRRIRANRNRLRIDIDKTLSDLGEGKYHNPELPNGGARVSSFATDILSGEDTPPSQPETDVLRKPSSGLVGKQKSYTSSKYQVDSSTKPKLDLSSEPGTGPAESHNSELKDSSIPTLNDFNAVDYQESGTDSFELPSETAVFTAADAKNTDIDQSGVTSAVSELSAADETTSKTDFELEHQFESVDEPESPKVAKFELEPELEPDVELEPEPEPEPEPAEPEPEVEVKAKADTEFLTPDATKPDYSGLDPLFDDIPPGPLVSDKQDQQEAQSNLYLDLDLEQPIHQIMANKAASKDSGKDSNQDYSRRTPEKPRRRQVENPSFTLPLDEPEDDLLSDMGLSALDSEFESEPQAPAPVAQTPSASEMSEMRTADAQTASSVASRSAAASARKVLSDMPDPDEVLVITVVGRDRQKLPGEPLKKVVEACGMEFGDMSIYHRFEGNAAASSLQFSMANAVNPGTFDPDAMDELETPAVSFFMSMREPKDPMTAYECMLATAETLAKHLNGDLLDEDRSVMREQTKEHYRQRIRDFEMQSRRRKLGR